MAAGSVFGGIPDDEPEADEMMVKMVWSGRVGSQESICGGH